MLESFGARLRQRREQLGIDLVAIAEQTKIKRSLLEALERDDVSCWPSGIFRRAYVRAYGHAVGLDPDVVVREFLQAHPERLDVAPIEEIASLAGGARPCDSASTRFRSFMGSALTSLLGRGPLAESGAADRSGVEAAGAYEFDVLEQVVPATRPEVRKAPAPVAEVDAVDMPAAVEAHVPPPDVQRAAPAANAVTVDRDETAAAPERPATAPPQRSDADLMAFAQLCTEFARVEEPRDVRRLLMDAAAIVDAKGLIVWVWDPAADGLRPALAHGYSDRVLAHLPTVRRDEDNATAAAFRTATPCVIGGGADGTGAIVAPLMTAEGCAGVLALELEAGSEARTSTRAVATILAAFLSQLSRPSAAPDVEPVAALPIRAGAGRR